jgi:hypothetical protein
LAVFERLLERRKFGDKSMQSPEPPAARASYFSTP